MGSTAAAPVAGAIFESILRGQEGSSATTDSAKTASVQTVIPDMRGKTVAQAREILAAMDIPCTFTEDAEDAFAIVTEQSNVNEPYAKGVTVAMTASSPSGNTVSVPSLKGMTVGQANAALTGLGLSLKAEGGGIAVSQSVSQGVAVEKGSAISVVFKYIE
jgi:stage V sporulation protein D (sporulation-specific penicillin-binding protein)